MTARQPEDIHKLFVRFLEAGDLDALMDLYETDAVLVESGDRVEGSAAIRASLARLLAMQPVIESKTTATIAAGNVALLRARWTIRGTGEGGAPVTLAGESTEIVRRQSDGTWKCVIDSPYSVGPDSRAGC